MCPQQKCLINRGNVTKQEVKNIPTTLTVFWNYSLRFEEPHIVESYIKCFYKIWLKDDQVLFDWLIKSFSKLNIDLQDKNLSNFITIDDKTIAKYSGSISMDVEVANNYVEPKKMPETLKVLHETDEENFRRKKKSLNSVV